MTRDKDNLRQLIHQHGFGAAERDLMALARPSIRVVTQPVADEDTIPLGASKVGGRPDLPANMNWITAPGRNGEKSLLFIAQIDMADAKPHDAENLLPTRGILYFFCDPWGDVAFPDQGKVIHSTGDTSALERKPFPHDIPEFSSGGWTEHYTPCTLTFTAEVNLPDEIEDLQPILDATGKDWRDYGALARATNYREDIRAVNRLLGIPHDVPADTQLDCQLIADTGSPYDPTADQRAAANARKGDWQLLFQMTSDRNAEMEWGDAGDICFYIRHQNLEQADYSDICIAFFSP